STMSSATLIGVRMKRGFIVALSIGRFIARSGICIVNTTKTIRAITLTAIGGRGTERASSWDLKGGGDLTIPPPEKDRTMSKVATRAFLALFAASMLATAVDAHPMLKAASPAAESTAPAPTEIRLTFSEGVIAKFSSAEVKDKGGKKITTG